MIRVITVTGGKPLASRNNHSINKSRWLPSCIFNCFKTKQCHSCIRRTGFQLIHVNSKRIHCQCNATLHLSSLSLPFTVVAAAWMNSFLWMDTVAIVLYVPTCRSLYMCCLYQVIWVSGNTICMCVYDGTWSVVFLFYIRNKCLPGER